MPSAMIPPKFRAFDGEGKPLAFGRVYTYQAGTNVPKLTFRSEDGAVPNTNPVILNADGYADIFLKGSYKIVVKDVDEVEIWTADPVSSAENQGSQWINHHTAEKYGSNQIKIFENVTDIFHIGRRVQLEAGIVLYGEITATTFNGEFTIVTLSLDDADSVPATVSGAYVGILSASNTSLPKNKFIESLQSGDAAASLDFEPGVSIKTKVLSVEGKADTAKSKADQSLAELNGYKIANDGRVSNLEQSVADNAEAITAGTIGFSDKAEMDADLAHEPGVLAKVVRDGDPSNNGTYIKVGESGAGSWEPSTYDRIQIVENDLAALDGEVGINSVYVGARLNEIFATKNALLVHGGNGNLRNINDVFSGWKSPVTHSGEDFDLIRVLFNIESAADVTVVVEDDANNVIASSTRRISSSGWHFFRLNNRVNSSVLPNGVMHIGYTANTVRMQPAAVSYPANHPDFAVYDAYYTTTGSNGAWISVTEGGEAGHCVSFELYDSSSPVVVDPSAAIGEDLYNVISFTDALQYTSKQGTFVVGGGVSNQDRSAEFHGWAAKYNRVAGSEFNMVRLPRVTRASSVSGESNIWTDIKVYVFDNDVGGALLAIGELSVDPASRILEDLEFLLLDPVTEEPITLNDQNLPATYAIGYIAFNVNGQGAIAGEGLAPISNYAGSSYYTVTSGSTWQTYTGNTSLAIESYLVTDAEVVKRYSIRSDVSFDQPALSVDLVLADDMYAVQGLESSLYFDNILWQREQDLLWNVVCSRGDQQNERFLANNVTPGVYSLTVEAHDPITHDVAGSKSMNLCVADPAAGIGKNPKCLFIGDSTTAAGAYTGELVSLFSQDGSMDAELIGTITQGNGNNYEGRGGWRVSTYYTDADSPFVFGGNFSFQQYMTDNGYSGVDWVFFHLGINDIFGQTTDLGVQNIATTAMSQLQAMIDSIHGYDSSIKIGMMVTIPPSRYQDSFGNNYGAGQTLWRYKRNIMIWNQYLLDAFESRQGDKIYMVPININLDTVHNMHQSEVPANSRTTKTVIRQSNSVHPNNEGYDQMADAIYYFLKYQEQ